MDLFLTNQSFFSFFSFLINQADFPKYNFFSLIPTAFTILQLRINLQINEWNNTGPSTSSDWCGRIVEIYWFP